VVGGIAGGLVFGAMMGLMGMLPMIGSIVGSNSAGIGFLYHMFNSIIIGAIFGLIFGALSYTYPRGALLGLIYGVVWWVLGPLILMPLFMGMGTMGIGMQFSMALSMDTMLLMSLMGHLIYGLLTGLVYVAYVHGRAREAGEPTG
jgi:uncharacterized membrane protein YagU involved in acid resistance